MKANEEILIIGAGLGGLTFANALLKSRPDARIRILERDSGPKSRSQGYSLGIKDSGGILALKELDLLDEVKSFSTRLQNFFFFTGPGQRLMTLRGSASDDDMTLRVPREMLRDTLMKKVGHLIEFGKQCTGYENLKDGVMANLSDGSTVKGSLLVACDGVNSAIRQQMIGDEKQFLGITAIVGTLSGIVPHELLANGGPFLSLGNRTSFFAYSHNGETVWSVTKTGKLGAGLDLNLKEMALTWTKEFHSPVQSIVEQTNSSKIESREYYDRDPLKKARDGFVVLLGDAAHPMSPFQGQGANTAMADAVVLAKELCDKELQDAIRAYEKEMLGRSKEYLLDSRRAAKNFHTGNPLIIGLRNLGMRTADKIMRLKIAD